MKKLNFSRFGKIAILMIAFFAMSATTKTLATGLIYQTINDGAWNDAATWGVSSNVTGPFNPATDFPNGSNASSVSIVNKVTLSTSDIVANNLVIHSVGGELDLGTQYITVIGTHANLYGKISSTIQNNTTYGHIENSGSVGISINSSTVINLSAAVGGSRPTTLVDYYLIQAPGASVSGSPTPSNITPSNLWRSNAWSYTVGDDFFKLSYSGVTYKSKGTLSSNWRATSSTWESSTNGVDYVQAQDYPTETNADLVIVNKQVTLHNNETVNDLQVEATGDLAVSLFTLNLLGNATIAGTLTTIISNNTTYGKITSSNTGLIDIDNMRLTVVSGALEPTTTVEYIFIDAPNGTVTQNSNPANILPDALWKSDSWIMSTSSHSFGLTYDGTVRWFKTVAVNGGAWNNHLIWNVSTDLGNTWSVTTDYPNGVNVDSIIVEHPVSLSSNVTANNLYLNSAIVLNLSHYTLTLVGNAKLDGQLWTSIQDNSTYGKITSSSIGKINIDNLHMKVTKGLATTQPTTIVQYTFISAPNAAISTSPTSANILPTTLWKSERWSMTADVNAFSLSYDGTVRWFKTDPAKAGTWAQPIWLVSTDLGTNWTSTSDYPNGVNVDSIIIEHPVTLLGNTTANNLLITDNPLAALNLSTHTLTLVGNATINGKVLTIINDNSSYGKIVSSTAGKINIDNMTLTTHAGASATEPTSSVKYIIISAPNAVVTQNPNPLFIMPDNLWNPLLWNLGTGSDELSITYNGTVTSLNTPKLAKAYAVNGKLIYSDGAVYNAMGAKVASGIGRQEVALTSGVYIVKSATGVQKVFVK